MTNPTGRCGSEADYIRGRGVRAFEQLMWDHDMDPTNLNRASIL
jgi:hypothetical protein